MKTRMTSKQIDQVFPLGLDLTEQILDLDFLFEPMTAVAPEPADIEAVINCAEAAAAKRAKRKFKSKGR